MTSPPLDLICVSYLADANIQHVADYPAANHGAIITERIDSIAADGPITALTARLLGLRVGLISNQIGADPEGQRLLATLDRAHIKHTIEPATSGTTPKLTVITDNAGTRTWFAWLDHAYAQLAVADLSMISTARLAYVDCYSAITEAATCAIRFAERTPLILNLGSDQLHPDIQQAAQGRQILAVQTSIDETDAGDAEALAADIFGRLRPQAAVITLGRHGAIALTRDGLHHAEAPQAPVRHTHGAGAAFSAGYAHALLLGGTVDEALAAGCRLGTDHCTGRNPIIPAQRQLQPALRCINEFRGVHPCGRRSWEMKKNLLVQRRKALGLSQEKLAELVGVDVSTVRRWEAGNTEPQPLMRPRLAAALKISVETLAALFGHVDEVRPDSLNISIPIDVIWPELREGELSAHPHPWVAERTLRELAILMRCDMLTRRETLTSTVKAVSGPALLAPIAGWLGAPPGRLEPRDHGTQRIGAADVAAIERSTRYFAATDAEIGGVFSREAAVGQLKYAVDLARHSNYSEPVGNRLLAVIAELSGLVGWLCHDSGLVGPAQRYFTYGLQAARESTDPRARLLVVSILADMGQQMRWLDHPDAALQLHDLAIRQIPKDRGRFNVLRAVLAAKRAENGLAHLGPSRLPEVRSALSQSFDLFARADAEDKATAATLWHRALDMSEAELSMAAAAAYMTMAPKDSRLAAEAERYTVAQLADVPEGQGRNKTFGHIRLARLRLLAGEAEQACDDADQALRMAQTVSSAMIRTKLRDLLAESEPYAKVPRVREFRERLRGSITCAN